MYLRARFYAPEQNRFSQKDVLRGAAADPLTLNRYLYVQNDPVNYIDPSGERNTAVMVADSGGGGVMKTTVSPKSVVQKAANVVGNRISSYRPGASSSTKIADSKFSTDKVVRQNRIGSPSVNAAKKAKIAARAFKENGLQVNSRTVSVADMREFAYQCEMQHSDWMWNLLVGCSEKDAKSFMKGMSAALVRNVGETGASLVGLIEQLFTGQATLAKHIRSNVDADYLRISGGASNKSLYYQGLITGDFVLMAANIALLFLGGAAVEGAAAAAETGEVLSVAGEASVAAGAILEAGLSLEGIIQATNLYQDYSAYSDELSIGNKTPDYVTDFRVPTDNETVLSGSDYTRTKLTNQGRRVYEKDGLYYCVDNAHKGNSAHIEVFDRFGHHIGEANPLTGELIPGTGDPTKHLNVR